MTSPFAKQATSTLPKADGADLARMQIERALQIADARPLTNKIAQAAEAAGVELLLTLPAPDGDGSTAVMRVSDATGERFLQVRIGEAGVTISEANEIDPVLLRLARTSVDVLQRIGADPDIRAPLAAG